MIFKYITICLCSAAAFLSVTGCVRDPIIRAEGHYWTPELSGEGRFENNDGQGTDVHFKDDLGFSNEDFPTGRLSLNLGRNHRLRAGYTRIGYDGDNEITQDVIFAGRRFESDSELSTDFDMQYVQLGWTWQFFNLLRRRFRLGTMLDIKGLDVKTKMEGTVNGQSKTEKADFQLPFPTFGLAANLRPIGMIDVYAEGAAISAGKYGWFGDGEIGVRFSPVHTFSIIAGYRALVFDFEYEDNFLDMQIHGPFAGLSLNF